MSLTKTEIVSYVAGGTALLSGLVLWLGKRNRFAPWVMAGGLGLVAVGGTTSYWRRKSTKLAGSGLGLAEISQTQRGDKTLRLWHDDKMGVKERIELLQGLTAKSVQDPDVRRLALAITGYGDRTIQVGDETVHVKGAGCTARDDMCELRAIFDWTSDPRNLRYTGDVGEHVLTPGADPEAVDFFTTARRAIEQRGEDCDGHSVVNASLAIANGFPARFRVTSNTGESWDHIYTMAGIPKLTPKKWIALDTTLGVGRFNKQPKFAKYIDFHA